GDAIGGGAEEICSFEYALLSGDCTGAIAAAPAYNAPLFNAYFVAKAPTSAMYADGVAGLISLPSNWPSGVMITSVGTRVMPNDCAVAGFSSAFNFTGTNCCSIADATPG